MYKLVVEDQEGRIVQSTLVVSADKAQGLKDRIQSDPQVRAVYLHLSPLEIDDHDIQWLLDDIDNTIINNS